MKKPSISVFFPCYNDSKTIGHLVLESEKILKKISSKFEIIVVNDGSQDNSLEVLQNLRQKVKKLRIINHRKNRGYGGALASGFEAARYSLVFYTDGDGQYDVSELPLLLNCLTKDIDVVNGIKLDRQDTTARIIIGNAYKSVVRNFFDIPIYDVDCDFRLIRRKFLNGIKIKYHSGAVCVELVKRLQKNNARFREVSVHHYSRRFGTSQFFKFWPLFYTAIDLLKLFTELRRRKQNSNTNLSRSGFTTRLRKFLFGPQDRFFSQVQTTLEGTQERYYSGSDKYFEKLAKHNEKTFAPWVSFLKQFVPNKAGIRILEIGCGRGLSSFLISKAFPKANITGTDISPRFIKFAKKNYHRRNLDYKAMSAIKISEANDSVDVVCLFDVIEHIADVEGFLEEVGRILKKGGWILISSPNSLNLWVPYRDLIRWRIRPPYTTHPWQNVFILFRDAFLLAWKYFSKNPKFLYVRPDLRENLASLSDTDMVYLANPVDLEKFLKRHGFKVASRSSIKEVNPGLAKLETLFYPFYSIRIAAKKIN